MIDLGLGDLLREIAQKRTVKASMHNLRCGSHPFRGPRYERDSALFESAMEGLINGKGSMRADIATGLSKAVVVCGRSIAWSWEEKGNLSGGGMP